MPETNALARSLHDVGLAAWFGGGLMGAVGLNGAAADARDPRERSRLSSVGWKRWAPVQVAAVGAHLLGGAQLTQANKSRLVGQRGVAGASTVKAALTVAAAGATAYAGMLGRQVDREQAPAVGATEPSTSASPEQSDAQRRLKVLQWVIPALTGAVLVVNARMGEQQRPLEVAAGLARRLTPGR